MKTTLFVGFLVVSFLAAADVVVSDDWVKGELTDVVCRDYRQPTDKKDLKAQELQWLKVAGRGVLKEWKLLKVVDPAIKKVTKNYEGYYVLSGTIISDNTGMKKQGVPIYSGNLEERKMLRLIALSDIDGRFKVSLPVYFGAKTEIQDRFLYVGESPILLMRYSIPYEKAHLAAGRDDEKQ